MERVHCSTDVEEDAPDCETRFEELVLAEYDCSFEEDGRDEDPEREDEGYAYGVGRDRAAASEEFCLWGRTMGIGA